MAEDLKKPIEEPPLERLKRVAEALKKTGVNPVRGQRGVVEVQTPLEGEESKLSSSPFASAREVNGAKKEHKEDKPLTGQREQTPLSDLIQEKMKLEKILQELNNLKSKICQRIGLIKTIERREKELNQQLASVRKENDVLDQIEKRFENLKENIK